MRHIRIGGVEVIRAISYIVRDKDWGTYSPAITELEIESSADRFEVSYSAAVSEGATTFHFRARSWEPLMKSRSRPSADPSPGS